MMLYKIQMKTLLKYNIIFHGASYKTRIIEVFFPEYNHSQWIQHSPIGHGSVFEFVNDLFWKEYVDLYKEAHKICREIAIKHLYFVLGWDILPQNKNERQFYIEQHSFDWWLFWLDIWENDNRGLFKLTKNEHDLAVKSFYNIYKRSKNSRKYQFIENKLNNI